MLIKRSTRYLSLFLVFVGFPLWMVSCGGDGDKGGGFDTLTPSITSISPESGMPGDIITLTGIRFGTDKSKTKVHFNTTAAMNIVSVTNTEVKVEAPTGFMDQTVNISLSVSGISSNTKPFYYEIDPNAPPVITTIPVSCFYNATIVIAGTNFSPTKEDNIVKFGTIEADVTEATKTALTVIVPNLGTATNAGVTVTKFGKVSNAMNIAVDSDQNKIATTYSSWTSHDIKPGIVYKTTQFPLFSASQRRIHVLDVTLSTANMLEIGFSPTHRTTTAICNDNNAVAGVNAGYFIFAGDNAIMEPYIRVNENTVQNGQLGVYQLFTNSALLLHNNDMATVRKFTWGGTDFNLVAAAIPTSEARSIIVSGPMLLTDNVLEPLDMGDAHNNTYRARTAVGVTADGKRVFMVVVDENGVTGVQTSQMGKIMQALGAVNAMNFDGGGSSTMFVKNQGTNGLVNIPTSGSQRAVRNVIYVK